MQLAWFELLKCRVQCAPAKEDKIKVPHCLASWANKLKSAFSQFPLYFTQPKVAKSSPSAWVRVGKGERGERGARAGHTTSSAWQRRVLDYTHSHTLSHRHTHTHSHWVVLSFVYLASTMRRGCRGATRTATGSGATLFGSVLLLPQCHIATLPCPHSAH